MNKKISALNKRFNITIFTFAVFIYSFMGIRDTIFRDLSAAFLLGIILLITISIPSKKVSFHIGTYILIAGVSAWLIWGIYSFCTGIVMLADSSSVYKIVSRMMFFIALLSIIKVLNFYNLRINFIKAILLGCGLHLLLAYCIHFDGLQFLGSLQNIMINTGRYRNSYGFAHPNWIGTLTVEFFLMSIIYTTVVKEELQGRTSRKNFKEELQGRTSRKNDYFGCGLLLCVL